MRGTRLPIGSAQCVSSHPEQIRSAHQLQRVPVLKRICPSSALYLLLPLFVAVQGRALGRPGFPGGPAYSGKPCKVACMWSAAMECVWLSERACPKDGES